MRYSLSLLLLLVMASTVILAQTKKDQTAKTAPASTNKSAVEPLSSEADQLRRHQLSVLRDHVLARSLDSVKKMDDAALRLSVRNQLLSYLTYDKASSEEKQTLATQLARDSLIDVREHHEEISPFMLSYLANDLESWIKKHRPNLNEEFDKMVKATAKADASQSIRSLLELEGGDALAAKRIRQELEAQGTLNGLNFFLDELLKRNSPQFESLASEIAVRAGQGQLSFDTMFWISDIYLQPKVSATVRSKFLTAVVTRTQPENFITEPAPQIAYDLLVKLLPAVQQSTPQLYDQLLNQSFAMRASLTEKQKAIEARLKRLNESVDPVGDLKSEAEAAKTKAERNELLLQAAQTAFEKKRFDLCLELLEEVDPNIASSDSNSWKRTTDQLLKNVVRGSLISKLPNLSEKAAGRISSLLAKVEALILITRYYAKAHDEDAAKRVLTEAARIIETGPDGTDASKAFFLLCGVSDQIDGARKAEFMLAGIKSLNNLVKPESNSLNKASYQSYIQRLDNSGYELTRGFTALTKQDENTALDLIDKLSTTDLRPFALLGILQGLDVLLTPRAN